MSDLIIKPNINALDSACGTSLERNMGVVSMKFHTAKGTAAFSYKSGEEVHRVIRGFEVMLNRIGEETTMPGVMEERIKGLRMRTHSLRIYLEMALVDGVSRPQFIVATMMDPEQTVEYQTPPFEFLAQAMTNAEEMAETWASQNSSNNGDAPHTE